MPKITFIMPDGTMRTVDAPVGFSVMEIAQKNDIEQIEGACGGGLACATCHVYVHPDWWDRVLPAGAEGKSVEEEDMLDLAFDVRGTSRLSCQILMRADLDGLILALPGAKTSWET